MRGARGRRRGGRKRRKLRLLIQRVVIWIGDSVGPVQRLNRVNRLNRVDRLRFDRQQRLARGKLRELPEHVAAVGCPNRRGPRLFRRGPLFRGAPASLTLVLALVLALVLLIASGCGSNGGSGSGGPVTIGSGLEGPNGLEATVYASGLRNASAFTFDRRGRLWVTTSGATRHAKDGVYLVDKRGAAPVKVVSGLEGPLGLAWSRNKLYVVSIGHVDAFSGLRGTRFAKRETILKGPVAGGENNNLVVAPNGRLLMGVSASCDHCTPKSKWSAAIVSFRPDGSDLRLYARGIRAAYGLTYKPGTSDLFVTMNQRDDLGARTPGDWLSVVRNGEDWGFPACYGQDSAACATAPSPTAELDEHAAAGGVAIVTGELGTRAENSALVAEWQSGKVQRVALEKSGNGYKGTVTPFLTGLKNPLPVATTPDGALLVGDWTTGTIYRIAKA